jgi:hypothetical protein
LALAEIGRVIFISNVGRVIALSFEVSVSPISTSLLASENFLGTGVSLALGLLSSFGFSSAFGF